MTDHLPYEVTLAPQFGHDGVYAAMDWCGVRFGAQRANFFGDDIPGKWRTFIDTEEDGFPISFYFAEERDAFEFKMRWG